MKAKYYRNHALEMLVYVKRNADEWQAVKDLPFYNGCIAYRIATNQCAKEYRIAMRKMEKSFRG